jgi:protein gp37
MNDMDQSLATLPDDLVADAVQAYDRYRYAIEHDLLIQQGWHQEQDGRHLACALGVLGRAVGGADDCPAQVMPRWLARAVPRIFDVLEFDDAKAWGLKLYAQLARLKGQVPFSVVYDWQANCALEFWAESLKKRRFSAEQLADKLAAVATLQALHRKHLDGGAAPKAEWREALGKVYADAYADADAYAAPTPTPTPANWRKPLAWDRAAGKAGTRPFVFCASLADVFDNAVPAEWRRDLFKLVNATPHLTWLLLTKRPGNIVSLYRYAMGLAEPDRADPREFDAEWPRNAAIGCTVVTQEEADRDIPKLLAAKAALRPAFAFLSMEPLLGPVDLRRIKAPKVTPDDDVDGWFFDALTAGDDYFYESSGGYTEGGDGPDRAALDWVITGGETDQGAHKARPSRPDWFRAIRDQCAAAGVPYHHKQNGEWLGEGQFDAQGFQWAPGQDGKVHWWRPEPQVGSPLEDGCCSIRIGKAKAGRLLDRVTHDARP